MDIYKGTVAFSGIAIGKILYYHKSEYQIRQYEITDIKAEMEFFRQSRTKVIDQLKELYEKNCSVQGSRAEVFLKQKNLLEGKSFQRAIESIIQNEKVNAAYAVMTTRDEIISTFRNLEEPAIKERLDNIREISERLIGDSGRDFSQDRSGGGTGDRCNRKYYSYRADGDGQGENTGHCNSSWL